MIYKLKNNELVQIISENGIDVDKICFLHITDLDDIVYIDDYNGVFSNVIMTDYECDIDDVIID